MHSWPNKTWSEPWRLDCRIWLAPWCWHGASLVPLSGGGATNWFGAHKHQTSVISNLIGDGWLIMSYFYMLQRHHSSECDMANIYLVWHKVKYFPRFHHPALEWLVRCAGHQTADLLWHHEAIITQDSTGIKSLTHWPWETKSTTFCRCHF